ncbi:hypothetical protein ACFLQ0_03475 [Nitrospinota bacterium]
MAGIDMRMTVAASDYMAVIFFGVGYVEIHASRNENSFVMACVSAWVPSRKALPGHSVAAYALYGRKMVRSQVGIIRALVHRRLLDR